MVREVREKFPSIPFGIHCHNDSGCAVANTLTAVREGCVHIQGTVNGFGERCGNANLCSVMPALKLKMGLDFFAAKNLGRLTDLSRFVFEIANLEHDHRAPYVGESAFAHKGGIHVSAVQKVTAAYEHIEPETVGNQRRVLISDQAGKSNILFKIKELGLKVDAESDTAKMVVKRIKELEGEGFEFENADASFELLIEKLTGRYKPSFDLRHFRLINEKTENRAFVSEGVVKIAMKDHEEYVVATGNGPVNALDNALRKALEKAYPQIREMSLVDYKVRVLGQKQGTESRVRVLVESKKGNRTWVTVGVSENIIEASWQALVDSVEYMILKKI
jgi:2-isopropylmalate synthase